MQNRIDAMRKNVYIECGSYRGGTLRKFQAQHEDYEFHAFDPINFGEFKGVTFHKQAVWTADCKKRLYVHRNKIKDGSSMFKGKRTGKLDKKHPILVDCINFGRWLRNKFNKSDYIVVKMNIEGAEYPVLKQMIEDRSIEWIDVLYLSSHARKIPEMTKINSILMEALEKEKLEFNLMGKK